MIQSTLHDRCVYVTQYKSETTLEQLKQAFSEFGKIEQLQQNAKSNGVFIVFDSHDAVKKATSKTVTIEGKNLDVNEYLDMDKLDEEANIFIDGLSPTTTQLQVKEKLQKYGKILNIKVQMSDKAGVAYIQFEQRKSAEQCLADQANLGLHITRAIKKGKLQQIKRDQLFISNIKSQQPLDQIKPLLDNYFSEYGKIESIQVNVNPKNQTYFAFVRFENSEDAYKAVKASKTFQNQTITIQWAVNSNDNIEANLYTKNLKPTVTEQQLREAYESIVVLDDIQLLPPNKSNKLTAYIYLKSAEDGKKVIDLAVKTKKIFDLYDKLTVQISPMLSPAEIIQFKKTQQKPAFQPYPQPIPFPYQQPFQGYPNYQNPPYGAYPQQPPQYPTGYPPQQPPYQPGFTQQQGNYNPHRPKRNQYSNQQSNQYHNQQRPHQPRMPDLQFLQSLQAQGNEKKITAIVGAILFPLVNQQVEQKLAPQVTGILLDFENYGLEDQFKMLQDATYLNEQINQAVDLIRKSY
ncbi:unnamed protein product (macronuclear) [Paramecium tetraurelia]|uniref:Polyadenylate-binding protein n=1 Tax=Paramecium tetraurelia TaxID=5888 RepID=A0BVN1_PARTE|nr:uncharacterized protein GSPATT00032450001 [Paramecium tetraurelia]CAK62598.1 unnamed protein product [Paramecium tetraurelia]|eukprot:XP_001429996.1 hypothetical protein (macronuclear) [Paramecium tetraurelia strain d4-2]